MRKPVIKLFAPIFVSMLVLSCGQNSETKKKDSLIEVDKKELGSPSIRIAVDVGVVVSEMEKSLAFYRDLIGLPFVTELNTKLIGVGRMVQLKHGESIIKLVEMEKKPSIESPGGISSAFGYRYITLMIPDMDTIVAKTAKGNVPIKIPVTELGNGAKIFMVEDPDGNVVEFVQEATE